MKKIIRLFFKTNFQKKLDNAKSVFVKTVEDLKSVQSKLQSEIAYNQTEINKLEVENYNLVEISKRNSAQIAEISKFI